MKTVNDLRKKVESLVDIKQQLNAVQNMVSGLVAAAKPFGSTRNSRFITQNGNHLLINLPSSSGLANDTIFCVNIPSLQSAVQSSFAVGTGSQLANVNRPSLCTSSLQTTNYGLEID